MNGVGVCMCACDRTGYFGKLFDKVDGRAIIVLGRGNEGVINS